MLMTSNPIFAILQELGIELDEDTEKIIIILLNGDIVNENHIAEKLGMKINDVRKALYKLAHLGFASYSKEKDIEKKWWYVYNWQLDKAKIHYRHIQHLRGILHRKERELTSEEHYAYQCKKCKKKYTYEKALEYGFSCKDCTGVVKEVRNSRVISQISKEIVLLLDQIKINEDIARKNNEAQIKARQELIAKQEAEEAKEKKKKEDAKKAARKKAAALKKKLNKKLAKKPVKKKSSSKSKKSAKKKPLSKVKKPVKKKTIKKTLKKSR